MNLIFTLEYCTKQFNKFKKHKNNQRCLKRIYKVYMVYLHYFFPKAYYPCIPKKSLKFKMHWYFKVHSNVCKSLHGSLIQKMWAFIVFGNLFYTFLGHWSENFLFMLSLNCSRRQTVIIIMFSKQYLFWRGRQFGI